MLAHGPGDVGWVKRNADPTSAAKQQQCWVSLSLDPTYAKDRPLGVVLWAFVDDEVEARLLTGSARMRPQDWKSGDRLWIVEACPGPRSGMVAPFGTDEMLKDLKAKVFKDREMRFRAVEAGKGVARAM
jgi:hemolysin-activating ACP:hemolysin acyltransferase